jgi:hypothetical protein
VTEIAKSVEFLQHFLRVCVRVWPTNRTHGKHESLILKDSTRLTSMAAPPRRGLVPLTRCRDDEDGLPRELPDVEGARDDLCADAVDIKKHLYLLQGGIRHTCSL